MNTLRDDLIAARALIDTPEKWCKEVNRYEKNGVVISRCAIEAVSASTADNHAFHAARVALIDAMPRAPTGTFDMVSVYNDRAATTHADIMALFDRAINACEAA